MLPEAIEKFSKKIKVIGQYGVQQAIFQQLLVNQWYVPLRSAAALTFSVRHSIHLEHADTLTLPDLEKLIYFYRDPIH